MAHPVSAESVRLSQEFYTNPKNYRPLDLTADYRTIIGCIEPRDPAGVKPGQHKTAIQTAGGGVGEGLDNALALSVTERKLVPVEQAMRQDSDPQNGRFLSVLDSHYQCKFVGALSLVLAEMASPSDRTKSNFLRRARQLDHDEVTNSTNVVAIKDAAKRQLEYVSQKENAEHLVDYASQLYPDHPNVRNVTGQEPTHVWVTNLHPSVGQNRNNKPADDESNIKVRGYHNGLAAAVLDLYRAANLPRRVRELRIVSTFLRSEAACTVITNDILDEISFYMALPTPKGLSIIEDKAV